MLFMYRNVVVQKYNRNAFTIGLSNFLLANHHKELASWRHQNPKLWWRIISTHGINLCLLAGDTLACIAGLSLKSKTL